MVSFSLRLRISYLLLQDSSLVSFHLIQFAQIGVQLTDSPYIVRPRMMPPRSPAPTRV